MRLLIFLVLSRDGLVSLYRIISQISIYIYIFSNISGIAFSFLRSNYNSQAISTCCEKSDGFSHDELRKVSAAQIAKNAKKYK